MMISILVKFGDGDFDQTYSISRSFVSCSILYFIGLTCGIDIRV